MTMNGICSSLVPQLIVEIGDITRLTHKDAITAFADIDLSINDSGTYEQKSVPTSICNH